jgi:hypothetical protein
MEARKRVASIQTPERMYEKKSNLLGMRCGNAKRNLGTRAPSYEKFQKMLFKSFKKM